MEAGEEILAKERERLVHVLVVGVSARDVGVEGGELSAHALDVLEHAARLLLELANIFAESAHLVLAALRVLDELLGEYRHVEPGDVRLVLQP